MNIIERLLGKETSEWIALTDNSKYLSDLRYCHEATLLGHLARYALNKSKNASKEKFENMPILSIFDKLNEEVNELQQELITVNMELIWAEKKDVSTERVLSELADCAAVLTGLLAWVLENKK